MTPGETAIVFAWLAILAFDLSRRQLDQGNHFYAVAAGACAFYMMLVAVLGAAMALLGITQ